jgi:hypothetical protein
LTDERLIHGGSDSDWRRRSHLFWLRLLVFEFLLRRFFEFLVLGRVENDGSAVWDDLVLIAKALGSS